MAAQKRSKELTWQATAAANILEARQRKCRLTSKKTRAGCLTCRERHVKCDQTQPYCTKCAASGRMCQGYVHVSTVTSKTNGSSLIGVQLSQALGLHADDRRTFDYFLSWTAPRLAGALDKDFWCSQLLQVAHEEPMIKDAILALSILFEHPQFLVSFHNRRTAASHENLMPGSWLSVEGGLPRVSEGEAPPSSVARPKLDTFHALALKHYNRAIQGFRSKTSLGEATPMLALLSCVLFIAIETIRDNAFAALGLFKQGAKLVRQLDFSKEDDGSILSILKAKLVRVSLLAALGGHPEQLETSPETHNDDEFSFTTIARCRSALYKVMFDSHAFIRKATYRADLKPKSLGPHDPEGWSFSTEASQGKISLPVPIREEPDEAITRLFYGCQDAATETILIDPMDAVHPTFLPYVLSPQLVDEQQRLETRLCRWHDAFQRLHPDDRNNEVAWSLLMHFQTYYIWLSCCLDPHETAYDRHRSGFERTISLAERYVQRKPERQTFTFESEIVLPLYATAIKCRYPSLRRKAIELINKAPKKECNFGASSSAELAIRLIAIEEEGLFPQDGYILSRYFEDSILPSDSARIRGYEIVVNRPAGRHELRVTRYTHGRDGCWIKRIEDFPI